MKIVHVCLCGPMTDGWNYQENLLTAQHKKMGLEVTIIASQWVWGTNGKKQLCEKSGYINDDGVKVIRLPLALGTVDTRLKLYKQLYCSLESEAPDILFIHDVQFLNVATIVRYLKKQKKSGKTIRVYADNHVDYSNGASNWLSKNVLHKIIWKYTANHLEPYTDKFYGVLPARVDFLQELYCLPKEKCELLVMGADDVLVEEAARIENIIKIRETYHISEKDFLIVTGGKIDEYKTQTLSLMEAVQELKDERVKLIVFGSVSDSLREKADSLSDGKKVQNIGWIEAQDSYKYFAAADLVVFPGRHSVFWEQVAAQGVPMLCKEWNGTKHIDLGGNVVFLKESTKDEILKTIESLLEDTDKYQKMKKMAQKEEKKRFSYSEIARKAIEWRDNC